FLEGAVYQPDEHRPPRDDKSVLLYEERHSNHFDTRTLNGNQCFILYFWFISDTHHVRDTETIYICIDQTDFLPLVGKCNCEVYRNCGFSDSAFTGCDGDEFRIAFLETVLNFAACSPAMAFDRFFIHFTIPESDCISPRFFDSIYNLHLKFELLLPAKTADCNLNAYVVLFFLDADLLNTFCFCYRYVQYRIIYISNDFFNLTSRDHSKILLYAYG